MKQNTFVIIINLKENFIGVDSGLSEITDIILFIYLKFLI